MYLYTITLNGEHQEVIEAKNLPTAQQQAKAQYGRIHGLEVKYGGPAKPTRQAVQSDVLADPLRQYMDDVVRAVEYEDELILMMSGRVAARLEHIGQGAFVDNNISAVRHGDCIVLSNGREIPMVEG